MATKVYVINDPTAIEYLQNDDLEGFKSYLSENEYLDFGDPITFDTEAEALAFCAGLGYDQPDHGTVDFYPLRSSESADIPFIEAIENL